jgi:nucleotide-binding universal stress UspA family protein
MKTVLVPVDFSEASISAFRFALDIVRESRGSVHLLHVITLPALQDSALAQVGGFKESLLRDLEVVADQKYQRLISEFNTGNVKVTTSVDTGRVQPCILDHVRKTDVDLIVMGTQGATGIREWMVGSNTEKIVRTSPVPVISIKNYHPGPIRDIVFPNTLDTENQEDLIMKVKTLQQHYLG